MALAVLQPPAPPARIVALPRSLTEVLCALTARLEPVALTSLALEEALGCWLAEPLTAVTATPPHVLALRAGWAVRSADTVGAGSYSPALLSAAPAWVSVGEPLPPGYDAVLREDAVLRSPLGAECFQPAAPGDDVRRPGEDSGAGTVLAPAGARLTPLRLAAAKAAGVEECSVRRPTLEILAPSEDEPSSGLTLVSRLAAEHGTMVRRRAEVERDGHHADMILCTPGAYLGRGDLVARSLAIRPGEDSSIHLAGPVPVVAVPGRLDDALGLWLMLIAPCLKLLAGSGATLPTSRPLTRKVASQPGVAELVLLREREDGLEPLSIGRASLSAITGADHWLVVPDGSEGWAAGAVVTAQRMPAG